MLRCPLVVRLVQPERSDIQMDRRTDRQTNKILKFEINIKSFTDFLILIFLASNFKSNYFKFKFKFRFRFSIKFQIQFLFSIFIFYFLISIYSQISFFKYKIYFNLVPNFTNFKSNFISNFQI